MISIVVLFHRGSSFLKLCLDSLLRTTGTDVEILVLMNNADRREIELDFPDPRIRVVRIEENLGYARAANAGAAAARGEYLVFTDHDVVFSDGWLTEVQKLHFHSSAVGATGCRVLNPHSYRVLDFGIGFTRYNCPHPHLDQLPGSPLVVHDRRVQAMCTGGLMIERAIFERLGGFDTDLGNFYTDIDLCLRLKDLDRECWVAADANLYHFGGDFSQVHRQYKAGFLKSDVKAYFAAKNHGRIVTDMQPYYDLSWAEFVARGAAEPKREYIACCLINVADPHWYVDLMREKVKIRDVAVLPSGHRDAGIEPLYETLGYNFYGLRAPIAYFVDRFVCIGENRLWWEMRSGRGDIVIDRNGNIMRADEIMGR
jgi:GT2 family glycosyltransferase